MEGSSVYSDEPMSSSEGEPTRDRMDELEKRLNSQADEIVLLRSIIADLVRRVGDLESIRSRQLPAPDRLHNTSNGSTLTLPTRSSTVRSGSRATPSLQSANLTPTAKLTSHHMSTESLQSPSSTVRHNSYSSQGMRNSSSIDRLASPRTPLAPHNKNLTLLPTSPAKTTPMRKWTSNSDFQNGTLPASLSSSHAYHAPASARRYGSQTQLNPEPQVSSHVAPSASPVQRSAHKEPVFNPDDGYLHVSIRGKGMNFYVPSEECLKQSLTQPNPPPTERLKLEWVYGYRGRDCRSNLYYIATGEAIYFIASVVVLVNLQEERQRHYVGHTDDIRCLAVHPNKFIVASGQTGSGSERKVIDTKAHVRVWDAISLNTLHILGGNGEFEKGFSCLTFSKMDGGVLLCAIDESPEHILSLWDWQKAGSKGERIALTSGGGEPVFACEFHPSVPSLLITCGKSHIFFWTLDGSALSLSRTAGSFEKVDKPKFILCLCFGENGDVLTGDSSGSIISWGRSGNRVRQIVSNAHAGGVFVLFLTNEGLLIAGGKDKRLTAWDENLHKLDIEFELPEKYGTARAIAQNGDLSLLVGSNRNCILKGDLQQGFTVAVHGHFDEVWALATHPNHHQFATASYDRCLTLWSSSEKCPIWTMEIPDGVHAVCFHPDGDLIAVASISGRWYVLDTMSKEMLFSQAVTEDSQDLLSCIKYSPDGRFIAVASVDRNIYIYQVLDGGSKCMKMGKCVGHSSAVLCLDWSVDSQYLRSNSDNFELIYWSPSTLKQILNAAMCRDVEWESVNCILEYGVAGVWSDTVQALSVDCTRTHSAKLLAVGDDGGKVKLFTYPAMSLKSQCHAYNGHSNHVSTVRFLHDDSQLISTGGRDTSVLQWELTGQ